jgi:predicted small lipoprotein YifL
MPAALAFARTTGATFIMLYRLIVLFALLLAATACTSLKPIELPPEDLQQKIVSENILQPGKRAKIVTTDEKIHKVKVRRVDAESGIIETDGDPVQIVDIVAVETKEFSMGKTALLAAGTYTVLALIAIAVAPVFLL